MSFTRTFPELLISKSHDVKMYPIEPCKDGRALIEYDVLNRGFGDLDIPNFRPDGTSKSRIAREYIVYSHALTSYIINIYAPVDERVIWA
jgi:hypothetical protein